MLEELENLLKERQLYEDVLFDIEKRIKDIRRKCKHEHKRGSFSRDYYDGTGYWDYECTACGFVWSEKF